MSTTQKVLIGAGVFFLASKALGIAWNAIYDKVDWELMRPEFDFSQMVFQRLRITLPIRMVNRNPVGLTVRNVRGKLFYGQTELGDVDAPYAIRLDPNMPQILRLRLDVLIPQLQFNLVQALQQGGTYSTLINTLRFRGTVYTDLVQIPLDMNIPIVQ